MSGTIDEIAVPLPKRAAMSGLLVAQFILGMTGTLVATSLPTIAQSIGMTVAQSTWLVTVTILANCATTSLWARAGDRISRPRLLQAALVVYIAGAALATVSVSLPMLITARAIQGIGLAGITAMSSAVLSQLVAPRGRARANGLLINVQMVALFLGPLIGGALTQSPLGWRSAFAFGIPLGIVALVLIRTTLRVETLEREPQPRVNFIASATIPLGIAAALIATTLVAGGDSGWGTRTLGGIAVLLIVGSVITEIRSANPILPVAILRDPSSRAVALTAFVVGLTLFGSSIYASQYAQEVLGLPPFAAGLLLAPMAVGMGITSSVASRFIHRTGRVRAVVLVGIALLLAGFLTLSLVELAPIPLIIVGMIFVGGGTATINQNLVLIVHNLVPQRLTSTAGGFVLFCLTLGGAIGLALSGAFVTALLGGRSASGSALADAVLWLYLAYAAVAVLALVLVTRVLVAPLRDSIELTDE